MGEKVGRKAWWVFEWVGVIFIRQGVVSLFLSEHTDPISGMDIPTLI